MFYVLFLYGSEADKEYSNQIFELIFGFFSRVQGFFFKGLSTFFYSVALLTASRAYVVLLKHSG